MTKKTKKKKAKNKPGQPIAKKKARKKTKARRGRPPIEVDWNVIDAMCAIHCTGPEIAEVTGISEDTLTRKCKQQHKMLFAEYIKQKSLKGKASLRRRQWKAADSGDRTMLVWLGKQWLDQTDKIEQHTEHEGTVGLADDARQLLRDPEARRSLDAAASRVHAVGVPSSPGRKA
jgi:hypothetical protein